MKQYLDLVQDILENGKPADALARTDRTGVGTYSVFGRQLRFNLADGFPLVTTKKCHLRSIINELLWLLKGETNTKYLNCLLYTSPSPRDRQKSRMPSSA